MKILVLGDIMGSSGREALKKNFSKIIEENKIDFSIINGDESDVPEIKFLEKFSSMIRSQVASEVVLKKIPKLKFIYDNTLYEANSIDDLLKSLNE